MHILLGILFGIAALLYVFNMLSRNAGEAVDNARGLANLPRRLRWQAQQRRASIRALEDPREAAVVLLLAVARATGDVSSAQKQAIAGFAIDEFRVGAREAQDMILLAGFMLRDVFEFREELRFVLAPLDKALGPAERSRLLEAAREVAEADGTTAEGAALELIEAVRQALLSAGPAEPAWAG
jgi:uncharacterized tellurite resistance protein B-like protein